eukprot:COSAG02_NODE_8894_length_2406_cov_1.096662_2_plen_164_part_00
MRSRVCVAPPPVIAKAIPEGERPSFFSSHPSRRLRHAARASCSEDAARTASQSPPRALAEVHRGKQLALQSSQLAATRHSEQQPVHGAALRPVPGNSSRKPQPSRAAYLIGRPGWVAQRGHGATRSDGTPSSSRLAQDRQGAPSQRVHNRQAIRRLVAALLRR